MGLVAMRRTLVTTLATLAFAAASPIASAEESPYCQKVHARATGDAALLMAPTLQAQGIRFPRNGAYDTGVTVGQGMQFRAALAWSPLDFYRGFRVQSAADYDCARHEARVSAEELLAVGVEYGRLPALRREATFLDARRSSWETIVAAGDDRLAAHVTSLLDANEIRARGAELARKREQIAGDVSRLEALHVDEYRGMLGSLSTRIDDTTMQYEREVSHLRSLDAWTVSVTGGVVPQTAPVDWFGAVQIGFNFGAFTRNAAETRYLAAREAEVRGARYEVRAQLRRFQEQLAAEARQAERELAITDKKLSTLATARAAVAGAEAAPNGPHALAVLDLEMIFAEADRVYLSALVTELGKLSPEAAKGTQRNGQEDGNGR